MRSALGIAISASATRDLRCGFGTSSCVVLSSSSRWIGSRPSPREVT
jgi:hypothetical protein